MLSWVLICLMIPIANAQYWTLTGNLTTGRWSHTATLLLNGNVVVAGGYNDGYLSSAEVYNPTTGIWTVTGFLTYGRYYHTATLLPNGNVLVAGGYGSNGALYSAELYNATTGVWTVTGSLTYARSLYTATILPNGNVLVAGGCSDQYCDDILSSAELYNATTGVWSVTGYLTYARSSHTATLLPNGNVIVAAGSGNGNLNSAELYIATIGLWTVAGFLTYARSSHTATLLNGNVLVAGGENQNYLNSTELYNPTSTTGVWTATGSLTYARQWHTGTQLPNGNVLVAGGYADNVLNTAELYNATTGVWTVTSNLTYARFYHIATLLPNGDVLVTGGTEDGLNGLTHAELYSNSTTTPSVSASSLNAGAIAGGIVGLVGLVLLVFLLWLFRSRYWTKKEIKEKEIQSSELMSDRTRSATGSSSVLSKSDDIVIPFASLKLGAILGAGHFGQVFQATYRGAQVAVKKLKDVDKEQIMEEAKMMKSIPPHPNVLQYFGVSEQENEIMMVTELCDKGNLAQYLRNSNNKLNTQQCRQLCCQIASGMWHISTYGIVHRDLRAENIFLSSGEEMKAKVADFGMARSLQSGGNTLDSAYYRMKGAKEIPIAWTAPEVLTDQLKYVAESDVWSFGIVMWEIYSKGAKPFDGMSVQLMAASIRDPNRTTPLLARPDNCPDDIFGIMNSCWAFNPQDRPTFEQLYNQLS